MASLTAKAKVTMTPWTARLTPRCVELAEVHDFARSLVDKYTKAAVSVIVVDDDDVEEIQTVGIKNVPKTTDEAIVRLVLLS